MGIKFRCRTCDKKLHVKSFLAGKRGVCPHCGAKIRIPTESQSRSPERAGPADPTASPAKRAGRSTSRPSSTLATGGAASVAQGATPRSDDPIDESPHAVWYVRPPAGGQFGPADGPIMRRWLDEGRVSGDALVWREGWPDWRPAGGVFPSLVPADPLVEDAPDQTGAPSKSDLIAVAPAVPVPKRAHGRSRSEASRRHVAIVVSLFVVCLALLIALFFVLRG